MSRRMHLALWLLTSGHHIGSWRHPLSQPEGLTGLAHYIEAARIAERGKFDMVFFEDTLAARERNGQVFAEAPFNSLDPLIQIAALSSATEQIGLAASCSTTYHSPEVLAAKFASVDRLSRGRAGWNMVTSGSAAARNFGSGAHPHHAERYANAHEVLHAVRELWAAGEPSPQGQPVLIQAGMSDWGLNFAAAFGEAIFAAFGTLDKGQAFRASLRARAASYGRPESSVKVLPGFLPIIGSTRQEAEEKAEYFRDLISPALVRALLGERFNFDFTDYPLHRPFPLEEIVPTLEDRPMIGGDRSRFLKDVREGEPIADYVKRMVAQPTGHLWKVGSPEDIADFMETWFLDEGCDGFIIQSLQIPLEFELFVDEVTPILQRRGLFRSAYEGQTLRSHLDLAPPAPLRGSASER